VSVVQAGGVPEKWPADVRARLEAAVLAISVVTLAELRDGHIYAGWGPKRRARAEALIASYLWVPLDMATVDKCASLRAACRSDGVTVPDNDIWIAATAQVRGWTLVSCDRHFDGILDVDHLRLDPP
jgi:predicted nucleic acid-binding protein